MLSIVTRIRSRITSSSAPFPGPPLLLSLSMASSSGTRRQADASCGSTRRILTPFLLFYQLRDTTIQEYCRELKLAAVVRDYPGLCRRARDAGWPYEDLLRELLEAEITNRHQSTARRMLREARFPDIKTFDQLDWAVLKGVSRPKLMELASGEFIGRAENAILAGPIGTGKIISRSRSEWKPRAGGCEFTSPVQPIWCRAG